MLKYKAYHAHAQLLHKKRGIKFDVYIKKVYAHGRN